MDFAIRTLGCKVNQYETQAMEQELICRGHCLVDFAGTADVYIINTCSVTAVSDKKSRQAVRQARRRAPGAVVAVCGCYSQTHPAEARALEVDLIGGSGDRMGFLDRLERLWAEKCTGMPPDRQVMTLDCALERRVFEPLAAGGADGRTRAMLKVEDGCVNFCAYCIIPYARGPVRSLPLQQAAAAAAQLAAEGFRELVITGIEISSWGRDLPGMPHLAHLIEEICAAAPGLRVRLGSLEPRTVTEDFCRRLAALPGLCPHFHLSLQSGCDATLKRMNRRYDTARYLESVRLLEQFFDSPGITTDLIVGFPGETEEEFQTTLDFLAQCGFLRVHVFPYSPRPGTPAAGMADQVPGPVKEERARRAGAAAAQLERGRLAALVGTVQPVLFEEETDGLWRGFAPNYAEVRTQGAALHNRVELVAVTSAAGDHVTGVRCAGDQTQKGASSL